MLGRVASASQFGSIKAMTASVSNNMNSNRIDTGGSMQSTGSRLGLAQTPAGGAGGFNIGGMAGVGGGGALGWRMH